MIKIIQGNCLDKIKELDDNSIDCVVSSPPYFGLRDYGVEEQFGLEPTYQEYIANTVKVFETFKPKLKETATIWWNVGDSYNSSQAGNKTWGNGVGANTHYKNGSIPKKRNISKNLKPKDLLMIPNRIAIALQDAGWYIRSEIIWHKPNPMPESVKDRPTSCHEKIWLITKNKKYYYDADAIKEPSQTLPIKRGRSVETFGVNCNYPKGERFSAGERVGGGNMKNKRNVWKVNTKPYKEAHFATFPPELIEPCIKAGCPESGVVFDPFAGAGTTGLVADRLGKNAILIELNAEYVELIKKRIYGDSPLFNDLEQDNKYEL